MSITTTEETFSLSYTMAVNLDRSNCLSAEELKWD